MHGAGNDFIVLDGRDGLSFDLVEFARRATDRNFGIGADGVISLENSARADYRMRYLNADGSPAVCGNGMRCLARFIGDLGLLHRGDELTLETESQVVDVQIVGERVKVDMGEPIFEGARIPVREPGEHIAGKIEIAGRPFTFSAVGMGNPHCVVFVESVASFPLEKIGPKAEYHSFFPQRVNFEIVELRTPDMVLMRVWERGVGETLACGSGMCAVVAAGVREGKLSRTLEVHSPGGSCDLHWNAETNRISLLGPAEVVYAGEVDVDRLLGHTVAGSVLF